jgi:hypothetical protein
MLRAALTVAKAPEEGDAAVDGASRPGSRSMPKPPRFQDEGELARALATLASTWDTLSLEAQARWVELAVERVDYDGAKHRVSVTLHPKGLVRLAEELASKTKEKKDE